MLAPAPEDVEVFTVNTLPAVADVRTIVPAPSGPFATADPIFPSGKIIAARPAATLLIEANPGFTV